MVTSRVRRAIAECLAAGMVVVAVGCRTPPPPAPEPPLPPGQRVVVRGGQTLREIARETGVTVEEIVEVNGLRSADEIAVGQILFIPAPPMPRPTAHRPPPTRPTPPTTSPTPGPTPPTPLEGTVLGWPADGVVLRDFVAGGGKKGPYDGILIAAPPGTEVRAARDGIVAFAGTQGTRLGTLVVVDHGGELVTVYGHLGRARVKAGQHVDRGDVVGVVGTSGLMGVSPRVYFEVRRERAPVDPLSLLPP